MRERVEMSFESVRLEKRGEEGIGLGMVGVAGRGGGSVGVGTPRVGDRNVSNGSGEGWLSPLTPEEV